MNQVEYAIVDRIIDRASGMAEVQDSGDQLTGERLLFLLRHRRFASRYDDTFGAMEWVERPGSRRSQRRPVSGDRIAFIRHPSPAGDMVGYWTFAEQYRYCLVVSTSDTYAIKNRLGDAIWTGLYSAQEGALATISGSLPNELLLGYSIWVTQYKTTFKPKRQSDEWRKLIEAERVYPTA